MLVLEEKVVAASVDCQQCRLLRQKRYFAVAAAGSRRADITASVRDYDGPAEEAWAVVVQLPGEKTVERNGLMKYGCLIRRRSAAALLKAAELS